MDKVNRRGPRHHSEALRTKELEGLYNLTSKSAAMRSGAKIVHDPENVPNILKERPQWVNWRYEKRREQITKVPYSPVSFEKASTTDLMTWSTFEDAVVALGIGPDFAGVGFVFCSADPFVGIDLDDCRNPETGEIEGWARSIFESFEDAVHEEVSPSGKGIHLITRGGRREGIKRGNIEIYGQDRFFTVTGVAL